VIDPLALSEGSASPGATPAGYWEARADRFAGRGAGLAAVCSYGMPAFYNRSIHWCQRLALSPWLRVEPDTEVLDVGCGVGRWSLRLARRGARVTGVDLSPTMLARARSRARAAGLDARCRFVEGDVTALRLERRFQLIVGVTVLQHLPTVEALSRAVERLASHLEPGGRMVLLEAMPSRPESRCDTTVFTARSWPEYRRVLSAAGLRLIALTGVDPAPFKVRFLPYYRSLPHWVAWTGLAAVTALALPWDVVLGRRSVEASWHKVAVLTSREDGVGA
jgi:SAM-dependent methyltransferase